MLALMAVALLSASGCGWFRPKTGYELSPDARPLEVPPDLDPPSSEGAMLLPQPSAAAAAARVSQAFVLADTPASVFERVGTALARIEGVTVNERAALLKLYSVRYEGQILLIRIAAAGEGARISASDSEGREISAAPAAKLLGLLRQRLG